MSQNLLVRRLRPHLFNGFQRSQRVFPPRSFASFPSLRSNEEGRDVTHDYEKRVDQLNTHKPLSECYPRLPEPYSQSLNSKEFFDLSYQGLKPGETDATGNVRMAGRVRSVRNAGSKLVFMDIESDVGTLQAVCQLKKLQEHDESVTLDTFKAFSRIARKGDHYAVVGHLHRTERGENSILVVALPQLLSPSLHQIPESLDPETRARSRHVDMLVNPEAIRTLRVRHEVEACLQSYFNDEGFTKVTTPILGAGAGGAAARPFETEATELVDQKLKLRIAPELWLKRLIVGGMRKIYEIGPAFRNEGVDATHNPEFNICEFYQAYATLQDLMKMTVTIIEDLKHRFTWLRGSGALPDLPEWDSSLEKDFEQVEFIPGLEEHLDCHLPDLQAPDAREKILQIFTDKGISPPSNSTLTRLLDALAAQYLEPLSQNHPLFIMHHPACMSPLSKHFTCPKTSQIIAARAELFIQGREYANMYEEENSPFQQRRKFEEQVRQRKEEKDGEAMELDEGYLRALEWGLPPTGGWGCGVDRLVMLFAGRERMADVLAFGTLRNVVGLGRGR